MLCYGARVAGTGSAAKGSDPTRALQGDDSPLRYMELVNAVTADLPPLPIAALGPPLLTDPGRALRDSRVILITSAGVRERDEPSFLPTNDMTFRTIAHDVAATRLVPSHPTPVRRPAEADINVVFPRDRLDELAATGVVGGSADFHLSFLGTIKKLTDLVTVMAPEMVGAARRANADLALLVPL
jgi:D-proline reductase (dithiol) PrdB